MYVDSAGTSGVYVGSAGWDGVNAASGSASFYGGRFRNTAVGGADLYARGGSSTAADLVLGGNSPIFAQTVNLSETYYVFLTPLGDCPLYVAEKTAQAFIVKAMGG